MLNEFLNELRELLLRYREEKEDDSPKLEQEINDIVCDYEQLYSDALASGLSDEEVIKKLGTPTAIVKELGMYIEPHDRSWKGKFIAISPFISIIVFFVLGTQWQLWHPGWLVFLLIPVSAIALNTDDWMVKMVALSPFAATITFFVFLELGMPEYGWLAFLVIPMLGVFSQKPVWRAVVFEIAMILSIAGYIVLGPVMQRYDVAGYSFLFLVVYFLTDPRFYSQLVQLFTTVVGLTVLGSIAAFLLLGFLLEGWYYAWLVFLTIPMIAIIHHSSRRHRMVALMPFISTILFFTIGFVFGGWAYAWLVYLLIPMTAIVNKR